MIKLALATFLGFFALSTTTALAGIVIEPQVGYSWGEFDLKVPGQDTIDLNGLSFGAKLYYDMPGWFLGVDYNYNRFSSKDIDGDLTSNEIGAIAGLNFAQFFKLYGGYIFSNNAEAKDNDYKPDGKGGYKVGLSFRAFRHVALGVEYKKVDLKKEIFQTKDASYSATSVLLSFPFGS